MKNYLIVIFLILFISESLAHQDPLVKHDAARSFDGQSIAYSVYGSGDVTLAFVHGWSCDSRYWQKQLSTFAKEYKVITIDLAGHGNSSSSRTDYAIPSFAKDIQSVLDHEKVTNAILVGHSMGGAVIVSAAALMPERIKGAIGVDTLLNISQSISQEIIDSMMGPLNTSFDQTMKGSVARLLHENTDENLRRWITEDMAAAPQAVAIGSFRHYMEYFLTGDSHAVFKEINVPVITINARLRPTNEEENRKHIKNYQVVYVENTGHFPMLEIPETFNSLLSNAIEKVLATKI